MKKMRKILIFLIFLIAIFRINTVNALETKNTDKKKSKQITCIVCHSTLGKNLAQKVDEWRDSVHGKGGVECPACHGGNPTSFNKPKTKESGYIGAPKRSDVPEFCAKCHSSASWMRQYNKRTDQLSLYRTSVHGKRLFEKNDEAVAVCTDCHGQHDIHPVADNKSLANHMKIAETCASCHSDTELMKKRRIPTNQIDLYKKSYHGQILYGKIQNKNPGIVPSCPECHGIHGATPAGVDEVANVCGNCHMTNADQFALSKHQESLNDQGMPRCIDCHDYHEILYPSLALFDGEEKLHCGYCHPIDGREYNIGQDIKNSILAAEYKINEVSAKVAEIEFDPGLDVQDELYNLKEAEDYLLEVAPIIHTIDLAKVKLFTDKALEVANSTEKTVNERIADFIIRKKWLFASLLILFMIIGYLLFNRWTIHIGDEAK